MSNAPTALPMAREPSPEETQKAMFAEHVVVLPANAFSFNVNDAEFVLALGIKQPDGSVKYAVRAHIPIKVMVALQGTLNQTIATAASVQPVQSSRH